MGPIFPSGLSGSSPIVLSAAPVIGLLLIAGSFPCARGLAHIVSEQVMATNAKSKAAANLLRLGFIEFPLGFGFSVFISVRRLFLAAAQMCFCWIKRKPRFKPAKFLGPSRNFRAFLILISRGKGFELRGAEGKRNSLRTIEPRAKRSLRCTRCGRDPRIPATFLNGLSC